jgi:hypothetical protein
MTFACFHSDQEMEKVQSTIQQLQKNCAELQYDLQMKERLPPNIYDSIECELIWKRTRFDETRDAGENQTDEGAPEDCTTNSTTPPALSSSPSPTTYERSLLSFLVNSDGSTAKKLNPTDKPSSHSSSTILNSNNKKRRTCTSCGKC